MMLIRSSSTPLLGSLLPSESPNNNNSSHTPNHTFHPHHHTNKLPFHHNQQTSPRQYYFHSSSTNNYYNNSSFHSSSSPISPSISDISNYANQGTPPHQTGFRRAQSESNLEQLYSSNDFDHEFSNSMILPPKSYSRMKPHYSSALQPIPSFSYSRSSNEEEEEEEEDDLEEEETEETYQGHKVFAMKGTTDRIFNLEKMEKSFNAAYNNVSAYGGDSYMDHHENSDHRKMHLAMGPGVGVIDGFGGGTGGGGDSWNVNRQTGSGGGGHGSDGATSEDANDMMDEHYKRMVDENPGNAMFLRNYADFLHKSKIDLKGAEEYYSRSILADPTDGEVLSQYAKLVWDLHRDEDRATSYFERAVRTAPQDSHVHAAYASFLWEIEEADEDDQNDLDLMAPGDHLREGTMATVGA